MLPAFADVSAWQGDWGEFVSIGKDKNKNILSIHSCDSKNNSCVVNVMSYDKFGYCSGRDLSFQVLSNEKGELKNDYCKMGLVRDEKSIKLTTIGDCTALCSGKSKFATNYSFLSKENLAEPSEQICQDKLSGALKEWCYSKPLHEQQSDLSTSWYRLEAFGEKVSDFNNWFKSIITTCKDGACIKKAMAEKKLELDGKYEQKISGLKEPGDSKVASEQLNAISGVFKNRFKNGLVAGETYTSENIFEVVPVDDKAFYFKTSLDFFNGHSCFLYGVAEFKKNGQFVYEDTEEPEEVCYFTVRFDGKKVIFDDPSGYCKRNCGARGGFSGIEFLLKERRDIRYMDKILKSEDYKTATEKYKKPKSVPSLLKK